MNRWHLFKYLGLLPRTWDPSLTPQEFPKPSPRRGSGRDSHWHFAPLQKLGCFKQFFSCPGKSGSIVWKAVESSLDELSWPGCFQFAFNQSFIGFLGATPSLPTLHEDFLGTPRLSRPASSLSLACPLQEALPWEEERRRRGGRFPSDGCPRALQLPSTGGTLACPVHCPGAFVICVQKVPFYYYVIHFRKVFAAAFQFYGRLTFSDCPSIGFK